MNGHDLENFIAGFERFQQQYYGDDPTLINELRQGQHPRTLLIGCCDSRVDPGYLIGAEPGDIFVSRNVGNLVPPCEPDDGGFHGVSAAIQFALQNLKVERIIVLGHAQCGGIRALMYPTSTASPNEPNFIERWMKIAEPAKRSTLAKFAQSSPEVQCRVCEQSSILNSLNNLMTFPWVRRAVDEGRLTVHGWYFDLAAGELLAYSDRAGGFLPMVCALEQTGPDKRLARATTA
jgi:carbonic anhydrase